jgi:hypothetical protein
LKITPTAPMVKSIPESAKYVDKLGSICVFPSPKPDFAAGEIYNLIR